MTATRLEPTTTSLVNEHSTIGPNWPKNSAVLWVLICTVHLTVFCYHVTNAFQSESTLYICLYVKELLVRNRRNIWSLSDCNEIRTHIHLLRKRTLDHFTKLTKSLSCVMSTYLYGAFYSIFLSSHVGISELIHTLYLPESQELLASNRCDIWSLKACSGTGTQNHLVRKRTLNHFTKLPKR